MANNSLSEMFKQKWTIHFAYLNFDKKFKKIDNGIDGNNDEDDWLTQEEYDWLIMETLDNEVTDEKNVLWKEEDFLDGFYDDAEDDDDEHDACNEDEDEEDGKGEDAH